MISLKSEFGALLKYFIILNIFSIGFGSLTLYKMECKILDENFCGIQYCYIKPINRSLKLLSMRVNLYKLPIDNVTVTFTLSKRANGWKPFLYNFTFDPCRFFNAKHRQPVIDFFYNLFAPYSNLNHSCPYNHDIIVDNLPSTFLENKITNIFPFPQGEYRFLQIWSAYRVRRAEVSVYFRLS